MSDEQTQSNTGPEKGPEKGNGENQPDYEQRHEIKARGLGWVPLDEWEGEAEKWVDARDYNTKGEYISQIRHQQRQLAKVEDRISNLNDIHTAQMNA